MASRKDYVAIAAILKKHNRYGSCTYHHTLCNEIALYFQEDNPRFDSEKFWDACGYAVDDHGYEGE